MGKDPYRLGLSLLLQVAEDQAMTNKTITLSRELVERLIDRMSKAQMFKEVTELRAALADPVPPATVKCAVCGQGAWGCAEGGCHYMEAGNGEPVPPAGGEPEVLGYRIESEHGHHFKDTPTRGPGLNCVELVDRAHVTRLQAEVERLKVDAEGYRVWGSGMKKQRDERRAMVIEVSYKCARSDLRAADLKYELTKARELLREASTAPEWSLSVDLQVRISNYLSSQSAPADNGQEETNEQDN